VAACGAAHVGPAIDARTKARAARPHRLDGYARTAMECVVDHRSAYATGRCDTGAVHAPDAVLGNPVCERPDRAWTRPRRLPAALQLLLRRVCQLLRGGREVPCGAAPFGAHRSRAFRCA